MKTLTIGNAPYRYLLTLEGSAGERLQVVAVNTEYSHLDALLESTVAEFSDLGSAERAKLMLDAWIGRVAIDRLDAIASSNDRSS